MSETETPFDHRILIGAAAVSEDAPAGADPRGGPEFEELEAQLRRMETEGPAAVNWRQVIEHSNAILGKRGKDLLIGVWLAYALTREERVRGLAVGLGIIKGMVAEHWDGMQPPVARERARVGALEWLVGRVTPLLEGEVGEGDWPAILYAYEQLGEIDTLTSEKLRKEQVAYGDLLRALRPHRDTARRGLEEVAQKQAQAEADAKAREEQAQQQAAPAAPAPATPTPTPTAATPAAAPPAPAGMPASLGDLGSIEQLPDTLRGLSGALIARNIADPGAYLLSRIASWWRIRQLPPNEAGKTGAMPPLEELAAVTALRGAGQNAEALRALNELVWTAPFWLDGHRITAEILGSLGPEHAAAQVTVSGAMSLLLARFPELLELSFNDGRPFADPATRNWIEASGAGGGSGSAGPADGVDRAISAARSLVAEGKAPDALELLADLTRGEIGGRVRLVRQIAQARFCLDVGLIGAALPLLDHLEAMLKAHDLETWEPALAVQVAELRFRALTHSDATRLMLEERRRTALEETRLRLVRLDLATAAKLFR